MTVQKFITVLWLVSGLCLEAVAPAAAAGENGFDRAWSHLILYQGDEKAVIEKFALVGRAQLDSVWVDPEDAEKFSDAAWRRFRFGFKADVFKGWVAHLEADLDLNEPMADWYTQLTDAYIGWSSPAGLKVKFLKQSAGFTLDGATSSKRLLTLERNNLTNNLWFTEEYFNGVLASGKATDELRYKAGFFSSDGDPEIGWDGASWFTLWSMGYNFGDSSVQVDYVYQDEHADANTRDFQQILSLTAKWQGGPWGVWGDLSGGSGFTDQGQSDVWGVVVMPFYDFSEYAQTVFRFTHLASSEDNGLRLNRYENRVVEGRGNEYDELYAGLNLFFYGHKFKWQTGATWAKMADSAEDGGAYEGWSLTTGIRVSW